MRPLVCVGSALRRRSSFTTITQITQTSSRAISLTAYSPSVSAYDNSSYNHQNGPLASFSSSFAVLPSFFSSKFLSSMSISLHSNNSSSSSNVESKNNPLYKGVDISCNQGSIGDVASSNSQEIGLLQGLQRRVFGEDADSLMQSLLDAVFNIKRTFQPSLLRRKRKHGFLARIRTKDGRHVLNRRRTKGRTKLCA